MILATIASNDVLSKNYAATTIRIYFLYHLKLLWDLSVKVSVRARRYAVSSLPKVQGKFNTNSHGADTTYICKHSACLHTQKCAHNVVT